MVESLNFDHVYLGLRNARVKTGGGGSQDRKRPPKSGWCETSVVVREGVSLPHVIACEI